MAPGVRTRRVDRPITDREVVKIRKTTVKETRLRPKGVQSRGLFLAAGIALVLVLDLCLPCEARSAKIDRTRTGQYMESSIIPDDSLPFIGFWKTDCSYAFGLALERAGDGEYYVSFSGPSGGYPAGSERPPTSLAGDPGYRIIDENTIEVKESKGFVRYYRCEDSRFFKKADASPPPAVTRNDPETDPRSLEVVGLKLGMTMEEVKKVRPDLRIRHLDPNLPGADWPDGDAETPGLKILFADKKIAYIEYFKWFTVRLSPSQWKYIISDLGRKYGLVAQFGGKEAPPSLTGSVKDVMGDCEYLNAPDLPSFTLSCTKKGSPMGNYFFIKVDSEFIRILLQDESRQSIHRSRSGTGG